MSEENNDYLKPRVCHICKAILDDDFELEIHFDENHPNTPLPEFYQLEPVEESTRPEEREELGVTEIDNEEVSDEKIKSLILKHVNEEEPKERVNRLKKELLYEGLKKGSDNQASKSLKREYLIKALNVRNNILNMENPKRLNKVYTNKGEFLRDYKEDFPQDLTLYSEMWENLSEESKQFILHLPKSTMFDYGNEHLEIIDYVMTIENVSTPSGDQPIEHEEFPDHEAFPEIPEDTEEFKKTNVANPEQLSESISKNNNLTDFEKLLLKSFFEKIAKEELSKKKEKKEFRLDTWNR